MLPRYSRQTHSEGVTPIGIETQIPWWQPLCHAAWDADENSLPWSVVNRLLIGDITLLFLRGQSKLPIVKEKKNDPPE